MADDCRDAIPNDTLLVRAVRDKDIDRRTHSIRKSAFLPRRNGKDNDGLSVSQVGSDTFEELRRRVRSDDGAFCELSARSIRSISADDINLDVCPARTDADPFHALIKNVPTADERREITIRLAQLLAQASVPYPKE